ncbi:MAG: hypothetical protein JSR77_10255 [Planctomycetes bacterium]|nr:hypothetical protein [Planctomycetota bacterium]
MANRPFQFGAQPALDRAVARNRELERSLARAIQEFEQEQSLVRKLHSLADETQQRIAMERDGLASPRPGPVEPAELAARNRCIEGLGRRLEREQEAVRVALRRVDIAAERVRQRRADLAQATAALRAMEKLRDARKQQHDAAGRLAVSKMEDEAATQSWERGRERGQ